MFFGADLALVDVHREDAIGQEGKPQHAPIITALFSVSSFWFDAVCLGVVFLFQKD